MKTKKQNLLYMPSFVFSFDVIQLEKTNKESNNPLLVFQLVIIGKHKWDLYPLVVFAFCVIHIKHWQKQKTIHVIHDSFSALRDSN